MKFFGAIVFGILAMAATLFAIFCYRYFGGLLLLAALPLWLLFIAFLVRAVKP